VVPTSGQNVTVRVPIELPIKPMLAKLSRTIPDGDGWLYEPKWDGFRCIVGRDGGDIELTSRSERPFTRYFPELLPVLEEALPDRAVIDGEIVVPDRDGRGLDFDALLQRIHPAASRVNRLAAETPTVYIAFDLLALGDDSWLDRPLSERRARLLDVVTTGPSVFVTPATIDAAVANDWFTTFEGAGLDGIVAKRLDEAYQPDKRALVKVKHQRTADCALAGYRVHKDGQGVGSMLLGLFDDDGVMHHVGVAAAFTASQRKQLLTELAPLRENALDGHPWAQWAEFAASSEEAVDMQRRPGATSRWNAGKDLSWVPLRVERVVEVTFGQLENGRFRHGVTFVRWRPDRTPESCRYDQLDVASPVDFREFMSSSAAP
jgi:ATP-dependent DNA ligase